MTQIVHCLAIICRRVDNIPLVGSMAFVAQLTQTVTLLLQHLLQMESSFFTPSSSSSRATTNNRPPSSRSTSATRGNSKRSQSKGKQQKDQPVSLRAEIIEFIVSCCHFLEGLYDPGFRWRTFLGGKSAGAGNAASAPPSCPVMLHQETIPFLYESFETALADKFPDLGVEMLTVFGAVISGSRLNALRAISPATSKMLLKTVTSSSSGTANVGQELHISAIYCSAKSIQVLHLTPVEERQLDLVPVIKQYQQILQALAIGKEANLAIVVEGIGVLTSILETTEVEVNAASSASASELKAVLAKNGMIECLLSILKDSQFPDPQAKKTLLPVVINRITLLLRNCQVAS